MEVVPDVIQNLDKTDGVRDLVILWQLLTLGGIILITIFTIWHLKRRGMIVRNRINPPVLKTGWDKPVDTETNPISE